MFKKLIQFVLAVIEILRFLLTKVNLYDAVIKSEYRRKAHFLQFHDNDFDVNITQEVSIRYDQRQKHCTT